MSVDIAALRETIDFIEARPEQHQQGYWGVRTECGTAHCLAGWALVLAGDDDFEWEGSYVVGSMSDGRDVQEAAAALFGLTELDADYLFRANRSIEEMRRCADHIEARQHIYEPAGIWS